jgi:hypothetical protein
VALSASTLRRFKIAIGASSAGGCALDGRTVDL